MNAYLSWEKTAMFPFNVFAKSHLQKAESHMQGLYNVWFTS